MWLACATQQEIAEAVETPQKTIDDWTKGFSETSATEESLKWQNFDPPIYNIWKQQTRVDPFAGGGPYQTPAVKTRQIR
jgi:hypothetical protein